MNIDLVLPNCKAPTGYFINENTNNVEKCTKKCEKCDS